MVIEPSPRYEYVPNKPQTPHYRTLRGIAPRIFDRNADGKVVLRNGGNSDVVRGGLAKGRLVREVYAESMHPEGCGFTEIVSCSSESFAEFENRPDLTLLGWCKAADVWVADEGEYGWYLAMLATMNPMTETMFLTVVYDPTIVNRLWARTKAAKNKVPPGRILGTAIGGKWT